MNGPSLLTVAGWWVAWVYALSLSLPVLLVPIETDADAFPDLFKRWARDVVFKTQGVAVSQADAAGLAPLAAVATSPAPVAGNVQVFVEDLSAKAGVDFEVAPRGAEIHFEKGAVEGTLRFLSGWGPDIRILDSKEWKEPRSFRLRLRGGSDAVADGDLAMCTVTIDDGPRPAPRDQIPIGFVRDRVTVPLKDVATTPLEITAATAVAEPAPVSFDLFRTRDGERRRLGQVEQTIGTGERRMVFRLADVFAPEKLEQWGLTDTGAPGGDEAYELELMASHPLFPDRDSRICRLIAENTNPPPQVRTVFIGPEGDEISHLEPVGGSIVLEYDRAMTTDSEQVVMINGEPVGVGRFRAGSRRSEPLSLAGVPGLKGMGGRKCDVATAAGKGCCKGQGGCSGKALCGEPVPGDYMLIVVNNERLHDPDDGIVAEVKRALADEAAQPYGNGAIILNPDDEDTLTPTGGGPDPKKMFQPYSQQGHDVAGQLKRIEEVVARKREAAANPDLRAVVVWPERDLAAGMGVRPVAGANLQPMSFLLPDAAASYARNVERGLLPPGPRSPNLTVRAPKERELQAHLVNVIAEGNAAGKSESQATGP